MYVNTVDASHNISNAFNAMYVDTVDTNEDTYIRLDMFIIYYVDTVDISLYLM